MENENKKQKVGIIAALDSEIETLKQSIKDLKIDNVSNMDVYVGVIGNYEVAILKCGIGKVSASIATQVLISIYKPNFIINTGSAGAMNKDLKIGEIVISERTAEWDVDTVALGDQRGYIGNLDCVYVNADSKIINMVEASIPSDIKYYKGLVVTGDQFVCTDIQKDIILTNFPDALCTEMEGGSVGHTCYQNKVPFVVIRCISDTLEGDNTINYNEFSKYAAKRSSEIVLNLLLEN